MDAVQFLQKMIRINSSNPPGNEDKVSEMLAERCETVGIPYNISQVGPDRSNFAICLKGNGTAGKLFFCGHMDTVLPGQQPWKYSPFSGELDGDKLYGRGASDMKSGLAAMYLAIEQLFLEKKAFNRDIIFLATAGEEVDSCGAREYLTEKIMDGIDGIVIGEPTKEKVVVGHKGALWIEIILYGKTAHGSMPDQGINAVEWSGKVMTMIEDMKKDWKIINEPLGTSSMALTKINGGVQTNVIPDQCSLNIDIRSVPPQSHEQLLAKIKENLNVILTGRETPDFDVNLLLDRPSILTDKSSRIIASALKIKEEAPNLVYGVSYYTDGAVLNPKSEIPTLIYGPGDEKLAHQPNEYVDVNAYLRSIDFYKQLALEF